MEASAPACLAEPVISDVLSRRWGMRTDGLHYVPKGFGGSYHWTADHRRTARWFVTVDDLDAKPWLGSTRETAFHPWPPAATPAACSVTQAWSSWWHPCERLKAPAPSG